jgi:hypothetical protein
MIGEKSRATNGGTSGVPALMRRWTVPSLGLQSHGVSDIHLHHPPRGIGEGGSWANRWFVKPLQSAAHRSGHPSSSDRASRVVGRPKFFKARANRLDSCVKDVCVPTNSDYFVRQVSKVSGSVVLNWIWFFSRSAP